MIRFCDKVVWSVTEESMTWMQMLSFFSRERTGIGCHGYL